ncbi:MAG: septal ring lytic transglycosylase RlpA family protein [Flavobacteriaceae bacterium]|nr:septal ring lytic transglycosylase RlpA family protein [Flavobacteriaceae bacterium]
MKKVTLAIVLLVSLSFTAVHTSESIKKVRSHKNSVSYVPDTIQNDTLASGRGDESDEISGIKRYGKDNVWSPLNGYVSWYGGNFHGRKTSSGEVYNMNEFTAAHKTLPFGTRVKIKNPENKKEIVVRITDRGPFIPKREFDLSRAAFSELASLNVGVLNVTYEILP